MLRKTIVVGDPPASGGQVLPYGGPEFTIHDHRVALIGGRVYCEGCNSVGIIAKAGGTRRAGFYEAEIALEGDVVICHCAVPPLLVSTLQNSSDCDDLGGGSGTFAMTMVGSNWYSPDARAVAASKKVVDEFVKHPPAAEQTENICPNRSTK